MAYNKFIDNLTEEQKKLGLRMFNLVMGRVIKRVYFSLNDKGKEKIEKVFLSGDDKAKGKFVKENIPNFEKIFKEETETIEKEIKAEVKKQV